ncbi:MAG: glycerol-3-phosphate dehydrogenase/oxidase [Micrococcales bacterium]|nr:glycerol-3-phosphate dehydrogenase/oxidase [Micrococcales bacterium]
MQSTTLSPASRAAALARMGSEQFDILVVGGGVVGAGIALDAASRGLSVAIVEGRDWASGTSSRSSKLIHGGLRYLEMLDFRLVFEALAERGRLLNTIAPHLVRPVTFLYPLQHHVWERLYIGAGILLYDMLALLSGTRRGLSWHKHLTRRGARTELPGLAPKALVGAIRYSDAQVDDARHTLTVVRTAVGLGAAAANRASVVSLEREGDTVSGAVVVDLETGEQRTVRAIHTIVAGGVWTDELEELGGTNPGLEVTASKGAHIVVERDRIPGSSGIILRTEKSVLFVIPWGGHWIIGTTDTPWSFGKAHPSVSAHDVDYILEHVNQVLDQPLGVDDVQGVFAGLRPLVSGNAKQTTRLSREHHIDQPLENLTVIAGGKYTTYRVMAKDAVDAAVRGARAPVPNSRTASLPLDGADGFRALWGERHQLSERYGVPVTRFESLLRRYGSRTSEIFDLIAEDRALAEPLPSNNEHLAAEVVYAVMHEGAMHLDDVLTRRTRLSIESWDRGVESARVAAALMAPLLGWDAKHQAREVDVYRARVKAELAAQREPDDRASEDARLKAPEIVR